MTIRQRIGTRNRGTPRQPPPGAQGIPGPPGPAGTYDHFTVDTAPFDVPAATAGDEHFVLVDTLAVTWTDGGNVVLPAVPAANSIINVKDIGSNAQVKTINIQGNGFLIEGVATLPLEVNGASFRLFFDGTAYWIV
jgi:hypothetical protein